MTLAPLQITFGFWLVSRYSDEMFQTIPFSQREYVHGYLQELCILTLFLSGLMSPFFTALFVLYSWLGHYFLILPGFFVAAIVLGLVFFSFAACVKNRFDSFWLVSLIFIIPLMKAPWFLLISFWRYTSHYPSLQWHTDFGFLTFAFLLPLGLILLVGVCTNF